MARHYYYDCGDGWLRVLRESASGFRCSLWTDTEKRLLRRMGAVKADYVCQQDKHTAYVTLSGRNACIKRYAHWDGKCAVAEFFLRRRASEDYGGKSIAGTAGCATFKVKDGEAWFTGVGDNGERWYDIPLNQSGKGYLIGVDGTRSQVSLRKVRGGSFVEHIGSKGYTVRSVRVRLIKG